MKKQVCNYAVVRFMPYPETEEFVCVGIVLYCQTSRFFGYRMEMKRRDRITGFFPELDRSILTNGRRIFDQHLQHVGKLLSDADSNGQMTLDLNGVDPAQIFKELVRPRESLFRFGEIATALTDNPAHEVNRLFDFYVNRQFAQREEYQESLMARQLQNVFKKNDVAGYRPEKLGDDLYQFSIPFVKGEKSEPGLVRLIKPLNLSQTDTTKVIDHGDLWVKRMRKLVKLNYDPTHLMMSVKVSEDKKNAKVAHDVCSEFEEMGLRIIEFTRQDEIVRFAKTG